MLIGEEELDRILPTEVGETFGGFLRGLVLDRVSCQAAGAQVLTYQQVLVT